MFFYNSRDAAISCVGIFIPFYLCKRQTFYWLRAPVYGYKWWMCKLWDQIRSALNLFSYKIAYYLETCLKPS